MLQKITEVNCNPQLDIKTNWLDQGVVCSTTTVQQVLDLYNFLKLIGQTMKQLQFFKVKGDY